LTTKDCTAFGKRIRNLNLFLFQVILLQYLSLQ